VTTATAIRLSMAQHGPADARTLVLLHSLGADRAMGDPCVELLAEHHRLLVPDTRAHGASARSGPNRAASASVEACFGVDIRDDLAAVHAPTLVLWGDRDTKTPRPLSEQIARGITGATLQTVPDAGHLSNVDHPAAFAALVEAFVDQAVRTRTTTPNAPQAGG
jgi:pimeloyl-ACP methyl ester carboxylesterase